MPQDPALRVPTLPPQGIDPTAARLQTRVNYLEARVAELERKLFSLPVSGTLPTGTDGIEGSTMATTTPRLYVKVNGTWRYAPLT